MPPSSPSRNAAKSTLPDSASALLRLGYLQSIALNRYEGELRWVGWRTAKQVGEGGGMTRGVKREPRFGWVRLEQGGC
jgi:hypothetical protein